MSAHENVPIAQSGCLHGQREHDLAVDRTAAQPARVAISHVGESGAMTGLERKDGSVNRRGQTGEPGQPPARRGGAFRRLLGRIPHWVVALLLLLPAMALYHFGVLELLGYTVEGVAWYVLVLGAFFLAGALKRLNWRHALVMVLFAAGSAGAGYGIESLGLRPTFPYHLIVWPAPFVLALGMGEWVLSKHRTGAALVTMLLAVLAVACVVALAAGPLYLTDRHVQIPHVNGSYSVVSWASLATYPVVAVASWIAIPAALRVGKRPTRKRLFAAVALAGTSVCAFFVFFLIVIYPLAKRSLRDGWPFGRGTAAAILEVRGRESDFDAIWRALEEADWSEPRRFDVGVQDYRMSWIEVLARNNTPAAAERLAKLLRAHPTRTLAGFCAGTIAKQRRYEAVPVLMWHALVGRSDKCRDALEEMKLPTAALVIIRFAAVYDRPDILTPDFRISADNRQRLIKLLGEDAGPRLSHWTSYYEEVIGSLPTPLPEQYRIETDRVIGCAASYWQIAQRLYEAKCRVFVQRLKAGGHEEFLRSSSTVEPLLRRERMLSRCDLMKAVPNAVAMAAEVAPIKEAVWRDMAVEPPKWRSPTVGALEEEIEAYRDRVGKAIRKYHPPGSQPSSAPAD